MGYRSGIKGPLMQALSPTNLAENISGEIFFNNDEAMRTQTAVPTTTETGS